MKNQDSQQNKNFPMASTTGQAQHGEKPTKEGMAIDPTLCSLYQRLDRDNATPILRLPLHGYYNN
jgi:hypothetical protein